MRNMSDLKTAELNKKLHGNITKFSIIRIQLFYAPVKFEIFITTFKHNHTSGAHKKFKNETEGKQISANMIFFVCQDFETSLNMTNTRFKSNSAHYDSGKLLM